MKLIFATSNPHKIKEINELIIPKIKVLGLHDINCFEDLPETQPTIEGNASLKSFYVYEKYHHNCFADDTGLEIEALGGKPGVRSARYAGDESDAERNIDKVLKEMSGIANRKARFKTIVSLVIDGRENQFEGIINGMILPERRGNYGFGYDPIFVPEGHSRTFAEMEIAEKNLISHRALAVNKLVEYLHKLA